MSLITKLKNNLKPSVLKNRARVFFDKDFFDILNGTDTSSPIKSKELFINYSNDNKGCMNDYVATYTSRIKSALSKIKEIENAADKFKFYDLGCGKGKVLILASKAGFQDVTGVEYSNELADVCKRNLDITQCSDVQLEIIDAAELEISLKKCVFYIYNSFEEPLRTTVLDNIHQSYEKKPREIYIIYIDPKSLIDRKKFKLDNNKFKLIYEDDNHYNPYHIYQVI